MLALYDRNNNSKIYSKMKMTRGGNRHTQKEKIHKPASTATNAVIYRESIISCTV